MFVKITSRSIEQRLREVDEGREREQGKAGREKDLGWREVGEGMGEEAEGMKEQRREMREETVVKSVWLDTNVILLGLERRSGSTHPPPIQYAPTRA